MASPEQVQQYLAHWLQLGRRIFSAKDAAWCPPTVIQGDRYSREFAAGWAAILASGGEDVYLEGTEQAVAELLSPAWEIVSCSRCPLLVPIKIQGLQAGTCPCSTLSSWPNLEVPVPRLPIDSQMRLTQICDQVQTTPSTPGSEVTGSEGKGYPLPQSLPLQTAIATQIATQQIMTQTPADQAIAPNYPAPDALPPNKPSQLDRIRHRLDEPLRPC
ncbi:MAG: hypothetical protein ACPGVO_17570 [Spirulinaceae cyanobacterium]